MAETWFLKSKDLYLKQELLYDRLEVIGVTEYEIESIEYEIDRIDDEIILEIDYHNDYRNLFFIDEYQDTSHFVVEILLKHITKSSRKNIIGFFGDSMQSIYDDGIGDLKEYLESSINPIIEIKKEQNRRSRIDSKMKLLQLVIIMEPSIHDHIAASE